MFIVSYGDNLRTCCNLSGRKGLQLRPVRHPVHLQERVDQAHQVEPMPEENRDGRRRNDHQETFENVVDEVETKRRGEDRTFADANVGKSDTSDARSGPEKTRSGEPRRCASAIEFGPCRRISRQQRAAIFSSGDGGRRRHDVRNDDADVTDDDDVADDNDEGGNDAPGGCRRRLA